MPRQGERPTERARTAILALRDDPRTPEALAALKKGLASASGMVVEVAAQLVGEAELEELAKLMAPAFARFLEDPIKRDPGCRAKTAIAMALCKLRYPAAEDVFLK